MSENLMSLWIPHHSSFPERSDFTSALIFLDFKRRSIAPRLGFVGRRRFGTTRALLIRSFNRSCAISRLRIWLRVSSHWIMIAPSTVHLVPAIFFNLAFTAALKFGERSASKRRDTFVDTLLTFCPPGPDARTNCSVISQLWMLILSSIVIISLTNKGRPLRTTLENFGGGPVRLHQFVWSMPKGCLSQGPPKLFRHLSPIPL